VLKLKKMNFKGIFVMILLIVGVVCSQPVELGGFFSEITVVSNAVRILPKNYTRAKEGEMFEI
jgi:uncharacterized membrane protein